MAPPFCVRSTPTFVTFGAEPNVPAPSTDPRLRSKDAPPKEAAIPNSTFSPADIINYSTIVNIEVGPGRKVYTVPITVLTASSRFFKAATSEAWRNSHLKALDMAWCDPALFNMYLKWLHTHKLPFNYTHGDLALREVCDKRQSHWHKFIDLYTMGDTLLDECFCDTIADIMILQATDKNGGHIERAAKAHYKQYRVICLPSEVEVTSLWSNTTEGVAIRPLFVDLFSASAKDTYINNKFPMDFLVDVAKAGVAQRLLTAQRFIELAGACCYHKHMTPEQCYRKGVHPKSDMSRLIKKTARTKNPTAAMSIA